MSTLLGDAMALGCALAWTSAVLAFRKLAHIEPAALNLFKNVIASALLIVTMFALGKHVDTSRSLTDWLALTLSGVLGLAVADTLFLAGLKRIDGSVVAVVDCAYSPTVILLSAVFLGEVMRAGLLVGAPLVVVGLLLVAWVERATPGDGVRHLDRGGVLLCLLGVLTTAVGVVIAKPVLDRSDLIEATTLRLCAGSISLFVFEAARGRARRSLALFRPQPAWKYAMIATLLGTYVSMILWLGGMKYGTSSRAALLNQMGSVFLLFFSRLNGEVVPTRRWVGAALAIAGVATILLW